MAGEIPGRILELLAAREMLLATDSLVEACKERGDWTGPIDIEDLNRRVLRRRTQLENLDTQLMGLIRHG